MRSMNISMKRINTLKKLFVVKFAEVTSHTDVYVSIDECIFSNRTLKTVFLVVKGAPK